MSSKTKAVVPDAWDDDWENLADVRAFHVSPVTKHYGSPTLLIETRIGGSDISPQNQAEDLQSREESPTC